MLRRKKIIKIKVKQSGRPFWVKDPQKIILYKNLARRSNSKTNPYLHKTKILKEL